MDDMTDLPTQPSATLSFTVTDADTAQAVGSGSLPVLGTPRLLAWCEAATCAALTDLAPGTTSVGTRVELDHLAPSAAGDEVTVTAYVVERGERAVRLAVEARHGDRVVGRGVVDRAIVDAERFLARLRAT
jgi:fluoroacetyl-CoA thioesterase